ncbi:MAG: hypothetical protein KJ002_13975, partial [Candidatus Dadabacteria bacterium]|nr:hypothetical protein [Candidatus Dadabacteria bacterium]
YRKFYDIESLWSDAPRLNLPFEQAIPSRTGSYDQARIIE